MTTLPGLAATQHSPYREVGGEPQLDPGRQLPPALEAAVGASVDESKALSLAGRVATQASLPVYPLTTSLAVYKITALAPLMAERIALLKYPQDSDKALAAIKKDHNAFKLLDQRFRATAAIALASVQEADASQLAFADPSLLSNPNFMLEATKINYGALRYGSLYLRRNPVFILEAGKVDSRALQYASLGLKRNPDFRSSIAKLTGRQLEDPKIKPRAKPEFTHPDFTEIDMGSAAVRSGLLPLESVESSSLRAGSKRGREKPDSTLSTSNQIDMWSETGAQFPSGHPRLESLESSIPPAGIKRPRATGSTAMKDRLMATTATKSDPVGLPPRQDVGGIKRHGYLVPYSKEDAYLGRSEERALGKYSLAHVTVEPKYREAYMTVLSKLVDISDVDDYLEFNLKDYAAIMKRPIGLPTFLHVGSIKEMDGNLGVFARENIPVNTS